MAEIDAKGLRENSWSLPIGDGPIRGTADCDRRCEDRSGVGGVEPSPFVPERAEPKDERRDTGCHAPERSRADALAGSDAEGLPRPKESTSDEVRSRLAG